jgi:hypothetical protein
MNSVESERRIESLWTAVGTLALVAVGVMVNLFSNRAGGGVMAGGISGGVPGLAPEFRSHLTWLNVWLGLAILTNLVSLLGTKFAVPRGIRIGMDIFGAYTLGRMILGGPICVTPTATSIAKVLMLSKLVVLLLGTSESLADVARGRDPLAFLGEPDFQAS